MIKMYKCFVCKHFENTGCPDKNLCYSTNDYPFFEVMEEKCKGCGYCCLKVPCIPAIFIHGEGIKRCPDLYWNEKENKYRCKLMERDKRAKKVLYEGEGSSSNLNPYRKNVRKRD
jgi:Fe-S-cluster-containing hydrogenase component 2